MMDEAAANNAEQANGPPPPPPPPFFSSWMLLKNAHIYCKFHFFCTYLYIVVPDNVAGRSNLMSTVPTESTQFFNCSDCAIVFFELTYKKWNEPTIYRLGTDYYEEPCLICREEYQRDGSMECLHHLGKPRSLQVLDYVKQGRADRTGYCAQGDSPLSPDERPKLREFLLSENTLNGWQVFVHILFDIKLFLRDEESSEFGIGKCRVLPPLPTFDADGVASMLAVRVKRKYVKKTVVLCIWRVQDIPEFCLLRHLLPYLHLGDIEGDLLFPDLNRRSMSVPYSTYNDPAKRLSFKVTKRHGPWGTHSLRKTAYFLAS